MTSVAASCSDLFSSLRPSTLKLNIKYRNSNLLHLAAKDNNCALFQALISHGANINALFRRETVLMRAIKYSSADVIKLLIKRPDLKVDLRNSKQEDALLYTAKYGTHHIAKDVLERPGFDINAQYGSTGTVLYVAVFWGRIDVAQLLLLHGANPDIKDFAGYSPRDRASHSNQQSMVNLMMPPSVHATSFGPQSLESDNLPLHQAMSYGSLEAVKRLLREGRNDLNRPDSNGDAPLHLAVRMNSLQLVDLLLGHPCIDANPLNENGNTPLWEASRLQYDHITKRFLRHEGVNINFIGWPRRYGDPSSCLHHAILRLDTSILEHWLATPGVDVNITAGGQSPLQLAVQLQRHDALKMLLSFRGIEINGGSGDPPICQAVEAGARKTVQLLVSQGERLQVNKRTCLSGDTALCIAARSGNLEIVRALSLHPYLNPNLQNRHHEHPLFLAAKQRNLKMVNTLLEDGRLSIGSMKETVRWSRNGLVKRAIQSHIDGQTGFEEPLEWR